MPSINRTGIGNFSESKNDVRCDQSASVDVEFAFEEGEYGDIRRKQLSSNSPGDSTLDVKGQDSFDTEQWCCGLLWTLQLYRTAEALM